MKKKKLDMKKRRREEEDKEKESMILFVGDSIERDLNINKKETHKKKIYKICRPGGKVEDIKRMISWNLETTNR